MKAFKRANLALCTIAMLDVLKLLREAHNNDNPFLYLDDVHGRTIRSLINRDWIVKSIAPKKIDRPRYKITGRGLKACAIYEIPSEEYDARRWDGICCRCNERERGIYDNGKIKPYCDVCMSKMYKRKYALFGYQKKEGVCPMCNERPKHIMPSGQVRSYCLPCRRVRAKEYRQRKYKREIERVRSGEVLLCYRCHENPRYVTANTVQDYCEECNRRYHMERRRI